MKLGCNTALFNQLDLYGALQHIAWAGYDGAELALLAPWAQHIELNVNQSYINEVKSTAKRHGLDLFAILADVRDKTDDVKIKTVSKVFDVAVKLDIPVVTILPGGKSGDGEALRQEFKCIRKLSEQAESRGITLAVKPHVGAAIYDSATLVQMLDAIDSASLGVTLDMIHLYRAGDDLSETVLRFGRKIAQVHFRDCPHRGQSTVTAEQQIPGRGEIDFLKVLRSLRDVGYDKAVDVELIGAFTYPLSRQMGMAAEARGYLGRCFQELK